MKKLVITLLGTAAAVTLPSAASGQALPPPGTAAGTQVNNQAFIDYSSGGVRQAQVPSNISTFVVDERIDLTVAEIGGQSTIVGAGGNNYVTEFTVTNLSNAAQDFALSFTQDATGATTAFNNTDGFNMNNLRIFVDNGDGIFNAAQDTRTFVDELNPNQSVRVFVLGDAPLGMADGLYAGITLTATAHNDGNVGTLGAIQAATVGGDTTGVDIVFADGQGDTDAPRDGKFSDDDQYRVAAPAVVLQKTSRIISDPINGTTNPKRLPKSIVEYCVIATNGGSGSATGAVITDNLAGMTDVTYVAGSLFVGGNNACAGGTNVTDAADTDAGSVVSNLVTANSGDIAASAATSIRFRVEIK